MRLPNRRLAHLQRHELAHATRPVAGDRYFCGRGRPGRGPDHAGRRHRLRHRARRAAVAGEAGARADHARRQARRSRRGPARRWPTSFVQNDPREGEPATYDTEVRLLYDDRALYIGVFAKDPEPGADHRQRAAQGLQHRHRRRLPGRDRHLPRRAQRLPVRDQSGRREVGLADVERRPRSEPELGRHLGRRHAHRRRRLVRRDRNSVQDAEVRSRGAAELGHQLPAPPAPPEREQLLVAAAPHPPAVARLDGRHLRRPAGPDAGRQRPRQAVRARQPEQAGRACRSTRITTPAST